VENLWSWKKVIYDITMLIGVCKRSQTTFFETASSDLMDEVAVVIPFSKINPPFEGSEMRRGVSKSYQ
jgi:hypothetical protein